MSILCSRMKVGISFMQWSLNGQSWKSSDCLSASPGRLTPPRAPRMEENPFIYRSSLAAFVMGCVPYVASCPMWELPCSLPCQVYCSVAEGRASRERPRAKHDLHLYLLDGKWKDVWTSSFRWTDTNSEILDSAMRLSWINVCNTQVRHPITSPSSGQQSEHTFQEVLVIQEYFTSTRAPHSGEILSYRYGGDILIKGESKK